MSLDRHPASLGPRSGARTVTSLLKPSVVQGHELMIHLTGSVIRRDWRDAQRQPSRGAFRWGAATAAYQIEGAVDEDGRGESIWDRFCAHAGQRSGTATTGAVACDLYHRYREDVALMRELGARAYRFSIAWPRVLPDGRGQRERRRASTSTTGSSTSCSRTGSSRSSRSTTGTCRRRSRTRAAGRSATTAEAFAEYAEVVAAPARRPRRATGSRSNEPWVIAWLGYGHGEHAPGRASERRRARRRAPLLLSHGLAVEVLRREAPGAQVGITLDLIPMHPATARPRPTSRRRARRTGSSTAGSSTRSSAAPTRRTSLAQLRGRRSRRSRDGDLATIAAPLDFLGVNYYRRHDRPGGRRTAAGRSRPRRRTRAHRDGLGGRPRRPPRAARPAARRLRRRRRSTSPRTAPRSPTPRRNGVVDDPRAAARTSTRHLDADRTRDRRRRPGRAATSSGRCSTTSSGRWATRSASGSSASTTRRSSASRRRATLVPRSDRPRHHARRVTTAAVD